MPTGWLHISHHRPSLRSRLSNDSIERRRRRHSERPHTARSNRLLDDPPPISASLSRLAGPPRVSLPDARAASALDVRSVWPDGREEDCQQKAEDARPEKVDAGMTTQCHQVIRDGIRVKEVVDSPRNEANACDHRREAEDPTQNVHEAQMASHSLSTGIPHLVG